MPSSCPQWRALAVLGALLSVCCAARPINHTATTIKSDYFVREIVLINKKHVNMGYPNSIINISLQNLTTINDNKSDIHDTNSYVFVTESTDIPSTAPSTQWTLSALFFPNNTIIESNSTILSRADRSVSNHNSSYHRRSTKKQRDLERNERSANLSHITGATRKIQLYIKNRFLQILPDGTVNGTHDDTSDYSKYFFYIFFY